MAQEEQNAPLKPSTKKRMAVAACIGSAIFTFVFSAYWWCFAKMCKSLYDVFHVLKIDKALPWGPPLAVTLFFVSVAIGYSYLLKNITLPLPIRFPDQGGFSKCWRDAKKHFDQRNISIKED